MEYLDKTVEHELLYDDRYLPLIVEKWKQTEVDHSARDFIHEHRVALTIPGVTYRELYALGIKEGFVRTLFSFELGWAQADAELLQFVKEELEKLPKEDSSSNGNKKNCR